MDHVRRAFFRFGAAITAAAIAISALPGCGGTETDETAGGGSNTETADTYVLVHGALAASWTWDKVVPLLKADGNEVITLDLPAHGDDTTPVDDATLKAYTDTVLRAVDGASRPVVLVGHSMGGTVISQAAEQRPDKVKKLVYVAAVLLNDGQSLLVDGTGPDKDAKIGQYFAPSSDGKSLGVTEGWIEGAFCPDCSAEDAAAIKAHLRAEPAAPLGTPIHVTQQNWGSVPRVYVETLQDLTVSLPQQRSFYKALPCEKVISIDSGHCPFLTKPQELADALTSL